MRLGVDDTDSLRGMCTTSLAPEIVRLAQRRGLDLLGLPKLVRLNPNVPWKTRGNGAIAFEFGTGTGRPQIVGEHEGQPLTSFRSGDSAPIDERFVEEVTDLVEERAHLDDDRTHPAVVSTPGAASFSFYRRAVRDVVPFAAADDALASAGAVVRTWKNGRGRIGAFAACGWDAAKAGDRTFELLAYRSDVAAGEPRRISPDSAKDLDARFPSTFDNFDAVHGVVRIAPRGSDPVLFGIRGAEPAELLAARRSVGPEVPSSWLLFESNQATDDHVERVPFAGATPLRSVAVAGEVAGAAQTIAGGHVFVGLKEPATGARIALAAFEPTKGLRDAVRALRAGDKVEAFGAVSEGANGPQVNLEKVRLLERAVHRVKIANPICSCGKAMKSRGDAQGFRCVRCGREAPRSAATFAPEPRAIQPGWFEACVCARRHLAKPIRRILGAAAAAPAVLTETL